MLRNLDERIPKLSIKAQHLKRRYTDKSTDPYEYAFQNKLLCMIELQSPDQQDMTNMFITQKDLHVQQK